MSWDRRHGASSHFSSRFLHSWLRNVVAGSWIPWFLWLKSLKHQPHAAAKGNPCIVGSTRRERMEIKGEQVRVAKGEHGCDTNLSIFWESLHVVHAQGFVTSLWQHSLQRDRMQHWLDHRTSSTLNLNPANFWWDIPQSSPIKSPAILFCSSKTASGAGPLGLSAGMQSRPRSMDPNEPPVTRTVGPVDHCIV